MKNMFLFFVIATMAWSVPPSARSSEFERPNRPKIGLVLGGGGAKGAAHIGVLRVMEELKVPVDCIAGTSMGAIVGALYASGLSADEIENLITSIDWKDVFSGNPDRQDIDSRRKREDYQILSGLTLGIKDGGIRLPKGLVQDQKLNVLFEMLMLHTADIDDFDKLPIPYRAVAADIETGEMVVLKGGRLSDAARASMSVPGAFPPMELNGRVLIDGGIVRNVPVDIVRNMGADIIICVDVGKPLATRDDLEGPLVIMNQMLDIMMKKNVEEQIKTLGEKDIYINPVLGELGSGDFDRAAEIARIGEQAAREKIEAFARYSVSDSEYAAFARGHHRDRVQEVKIASVKIDVEGESGIAPEVVASRLEVKEGDTVDIGTLEKDAGYVYGTGDFERVDMHMKKQEDGYDLLVQAKEKSWGPNYLRFGMALESDFEGWSRYNILVDYTRRWVNRLGAEWKTQANIGSPSGIYSEFYQPLTANRLFFLSPHVQWEQELVDLYDGNDRVAQYRVSGYEFGIDAGIQPWMYGEARIGLLFGRYTASLRTGEAELDDDIFDRRGIVVGATVDQLDNLNFPNEGYLVRINSFSSLEALGADFNYNKVEGSLGGAFTGRKQTFFASLSAGSHIGSNLPFDDELTLGGFLSLSGLRQNQLRGQSMALARVISYHRVGESFIGDLYLGGSLESGNVWEENFEFDDLQYAGSVFLGYDTILGPLYLGLGLIDQGRGAGYFYLGRTF
jgi:NTE family protein